MEYIELSGVPESKWPTFREWFGWYKRNNLVGVVRDGDEIAMKYLLSILWDEFGPRRSLIFNRNGVKKKYNYMKFMQKAMA